MSRFLAIYCGAESEPGKTKLSDQQRADFLTAWGNWAQANAGALVDIGPPLFRKKRVTAEGSSDFTDPKTGYAIVNAASHDEAVQIFAGHTHLTLHPSNWIEVLECPALPD